MSGRYTIVHELLQKYYRSVYRRAVVFDDNRHLRVWIYDKSVRLLRCPNDGIRVARIAPLGFIHRTSINHVPHPDMNHP